MDEREYSFLANEREKGLRSVLTRIKNIEGDIETSCPKNNPFDQVESRIKTYDSACEKVSRKNVGFDELTDIAGVRIITPYVDDVYKIYDIINSQIQKNKIETAAMKILEKRDYIKSPKPNGYRSLHLIASVRIFSMDGKSKWVPVEIQIRSAAMHYWASIEHGLRYKNPHPSPDTEKRLSVLAKTLAQLDEDLIPLRDFNCEEAMGREGALDKNPSE